MAKITMEIQFDSLEQVIYKKDTHQIAIEDKTKTVEINQILNEIEFKFSTVCEKHCLGENIIESFFDVHYSGADKTENYKLKQSEIANFLSLLKEKYQYIDFHWHTHKYDFDNDNL